MDIIFQKKFGPTHALMLVSLWTNILGLPPSPNFSFMGGVEKY
jgi:hypothetical protein